MLSCTVYNHTPVSLCFILSMDSLRLQSWFSSHVYYDVPINHLIASKHFFLKHMKDLYSKHSLFQHFPIGGQYLCKSTSRLSNTHPGAHLSPRPYSWSPLLLDYTAGCPSSFYFQSLHLHLSTKVQYSHCNRLVLGTLPVIYALMHTG